jgi:alkylated DNA repair dioxygenase AlkB
MTNTSMDKFKSPIIYIPDFVVEPGLVFSRLKNELDWVRHPLVPRSEYFCSKHPYSYSYGVPAYAREYKPQPWHVDIDHIRSKLETFLGEDLDVCFLNYYKDSSDHLNWHSDDSPELDDNYSIVTVSLGAEREIWFRPTIKEAMNVATDMEVSVDDFEDFRKLFMEPEKVKLGHGSACVMKPGMQDTHQHRIPKASFICGERISLTYRRFVKV